MEELVEKTLPGFLIKFVRGKGTATEEEMFQEVIKVYDDLRKPDGTRYKGTIEKSIRGSLYANNLFERAEDGTWKVKEPESSLYERQVGERMMKRQREKFDQLQHRGQRKRRIGDEGQALVARPRKQRKSTKKQAIIEMLDNFSKHLMGEADWKVCFNNPFKGFKGTESEQDLWKKLGHERFIGVMQTYNYFKDMLVTNQRRGSRTKRSSSKSIGSPHEAYTEMPDLQRHLSTLMNRLNSVETQLSHPVPVQHPVQQHPQQVIHPQHQPLPPQMLHSLHHHQQLHHPVLPPHPQLSHPHVAQLGHGLVTHPHHVTHMHHQPQ
eukprot:GILK01004760.1.p1 GENE.GILK01004760.1~~GILK01004760.1.p1  ORF type:complete len:346 (-),score=46.27 GILK01004760.1:295-1260(-)